METDFNRAGQKAWGAGVRYDFGAGTLPPGLQIPGLTVLLRYAEGHDEVDRDANPKHVESGEQSGLRQT